MMNWLADIKLEDVFKSAEESMNRAPGTERMIALVLGAVALLILLVILQQRRRREAVPRAVNHHPKLLKETLRELPLKSGEIKELKRLAEEQSLQSPLVLLLCPSLLAKGLEQKTAEQKRVLAGVVRRME